MTFATQLSAAFTPIAGAYDNPSVGRALAWAQSFITEYCNQTFDLVTGDIAYVDPQQYRQALLPFVPVVSVSAVEGLLPAISGGPLVWTALTNFAFVSETGLIYDTSGQPGVPVTTEALSWPWMPGSLKVTYTHGYSVIPSALIDAGCRLAQQYLENPTLKMQRRTGDQEGRFAGSSGVVLNRMDEAILGRYTDVML